MKVISAAEAASKLGQLMLDAVKGETIILTDGDVTVELLPRIDPPFAVGLEEIEGELVKGLHGEPRSFSADRLEKACLTAIKKS